MTHSRPDSLNKQSSRPMTDPDLSHTTLEGTVGDTGRVCHCGLPSRHSPPHSFPLLAKEGCVSELISLSYTPPHLPLTSCHSMPPGEIKPPPRPARLSMPSRGSCQGNSAPDPPCPARLDPALPERSTLTFTYRAPQPEQQQGGQPEERSSEGQALPGHTDPPRHGWLAFGAASRPAATPRHVQPARQLAGGGSGCSVSGPSSSGGGAPLSRQPHRRSEAARRGRNGSAEAARDKQSPWSNAM